MIRRHALWTLAAAVLLGACSTPAPAPPPQPPIVFVHGNGDTAALWTTTLWRFESNGWPSDRLHAVDLPYPLARDEDNLPQPGRTSSTEQAQFLSAEVDKVLARTGAQQVVLVGNSRGGNTIRNYVQNHGGASKVSMAVLGGTPNHGVWALKDFRPNSEFNGISPFLVALNAPKGPGGDEVTPGVRWLTLRSDNNDKFAQPDGVWIGAKGKPTNVNYDGPALKGAKNVVLPQRDHREVSFHPQAFAQTYEFITGRAPVTLAIASESKPVLNGKLSGIGPGGPSNLPLVGAMLEVFTVNATTGARQGAARHRKEIGTDGRWGPFVADSGTAYEFVISAPGYATTHLYRSPFARSSDIVNLRAERLAEADKDAVAVVTLTRPRGYFGLPRDRITLDGVTPAPGIPQGVAGASSAKLKLGGSAGRPVAAEYQSGDIQERLVGLTWPAAENRVVVLELTY
jgi:pimeloyl-ACP methyl ester carboxylesterase